MIPLKRPLFVALAFCLTVSCLAADEKGPAAALFFAASYRGDVCSPGELHCYPEARGIPFADTKNIIQMNRDLWRPEEIVADFRQRMKSLPSAERKKGIVVILKTERCATKSARLCSVTTAAFEKESTPLVHSFAVYGLQLKPRDGDTPPGSKKIETGIDQWKNEAAGVYRFAQGPGAIIVILDPANGAEVAHTNAAKMNLFEAEFRSRAGRTPRLEEFLSAALRELTEPNPANHT
jgi:hypothetical protein